MCHIAMLNNKKKVFNKVFKAAQWKLNRDRQHNREREKKSSFLSGTSCTSQNRNFSFRLCHFIIARENVDVKLGMGYYSVTRMMIGRFLRV